MLVLIEESDIVPQNRMSYSNSLWKSLFVTFLALVCSCLPRLMISHVQFGCNLQASKDSRSFFFVFLYSLVC